MEKKIKIIGLSGSLRRGSFNSAALRKALELLPENAEIEIVETGKLPLFNADLEYQPSAEVSEFKKKIAGADAILFSSPEFNYSVPGTLKNAIDWASRPYGENSFKGKTAAIMGGSIGNIATARMQYHLRQIMVFLEMYPLISPEVMIPEIQNKFDENLVLTDAKTEEKIKEMLVALVDLTYKLK